MPTASEICDKCGRRARWWWPGSDYERPRFLCGYHKRAYVHVILWEASDGIQP
jgi:hypothetical protein